jgi:predicted ATPase
VFEDLHWADAESVALFGRLAVSADLPLLLVGTFRPEGVARRPRWSSCWPSWSASVWSQASPRSA